MINHTIEEVKGLEAYFQKEAYQRKEETIAGRGIAYFITPQALNEELPDYVIRATNDETKQFVMGISDSVPEQLQPYFILQEYIEFIEKGIDKPNRVMESEQEVIKILPAELKESYLERRIALFTKELDLDTEQPKKYGLGEDGRQEFEKNLNYLKETYANINRE